jgi:Dolichyl-phosphate-mannose-protein mannosyltransferase
MGIAVLSKKRTAYEEHDDKRREPFAWGHWLLMTALTGVAFGLRYWFNFHDAHFNAYATCDAAEYLKNAGALVAAIKLPTSFWADSLACLTGHASPAAISHLQNGLAPLQDLRISGPIFPLFIAWSYVLAASPFDFGNWSTPIFSQCLISSLTCLFIGLTAKETFDRGTGYVATALAAVYPAFILNSGRLYSETFAAFLLSVVCYLTVRNFSAQRDAGDVLRSSLMLGFTAACLQFTRSIMVVLTVALIPIVLLQQGWRKGTVGLIGLAIGFACLALPWLAFQKVAFGTSSLVVDRVGHYNFFIGNDTDTQGWLSVPYPDGHGIENKSLTQLAREAYHRNPSHWWSLLLDKPMRLFQFPWNDYRIPIGQLTFKEQVIWHQALMLLGALGICLGFIQPKVSSDWDMSRRGAKSARIHRPTAAKFFLLFVLANHCAYLFFITVPRYNLTAMVIVAVFAAAGITSLLRLVQTNGGLTSALSLVASSIFVLTISRLPLVNVAVSLFGSDHAAAGLVVGCLLTFLSLIGLAYSLMMAVAALEQRQYGVAAEGTLLARAAVMAITLLLAPNFLLHANASGRWYEWRAPLAPGGQPITQTFNLPPNFAEETANRQLYLLVDCDSAKQLSGLTVTVDDTKLDAPIIPAFSLTHEFDRFQPVAQGQMREVEWVFDSLTKPAGMTPADLRQWFLIPVPASLNLTAGKQALKVQITNNGDEPARLYGGYAVSGNSVLMPSLNLCSWEKAFYGVETDEGLSDSRYNMQLKSLAANSYDNDLSSEPGVQTGRYNIHLLAAPPGSPVRSHIYVMAPSQMAQSAEILNLPLTLRELPGVASQWNLAPLPVPALQPTDLWVVRISGSVRRSAGRGNLGVNIKLAGANPAQDYISPWTNITGYGSDWRRFDSSVPVQPGTLPGKPDKLLVALTTSSATDSGKYQLLGGKDNAATEFKDLSLRIERLPSNPLWPGSIIY